MQVRVRQGWARVRAAWFPILQASIAAAIAFAIARYAVGHPYPFFAPVSAWIALGFTTDRSVRRVAELAVGVAIGVALGDLLVHLIGNGAWQVAVVLFLAAIIAPVHRPRADAHHAGRACRRWSSWACRRSPRPVGRSGGGSTPRSGERSRSRSRCSPRATRVGTPARWPAPRSRTSRRVLRILARGLRDGSTADVEDALVRGRASQPALDEWSETATNAGELARVSPTIRKHRAELAGLAADAVLIDRAMRNARVLARRCLSAVEAQTHDMTTVAAQVEATARAVDELAAALGAGRDPERARTQLLAVSGALDPFRLAAHDWQVQSLVLLHRSLVVDLLEAAGVDPQAARDSLPEI